jgi:hypothetical protein
MPSCFQSEQGSVSQILSVGILMKRICTFLNLMKRSSLFSEMTHQFDWQDLSYLAEGTQRQKEAFATTMTLGILDKLVSFHPTLVSTVCVGLDIEGSDLDFICQFDDPATFEKSVKANFSHFSDFKLWDRNPEKSEVVASFRFGAFVFEVFGSYLPVEQQNAYRHLSVMKRLAEFGGEPFRTKVREYKRQGLKTEPSMAKILGLSGNPFQAVLELEACSDEQLRDLVQSALRHRTNRKER